MAVKTPSYWLEEKYQPLVEAETAYGNKVLIPQLYAENWELYQATKELMLEFWQRGQAAGYLAPTDNPRQKWAVDLMRTFLEVYEE